MLNKQAMKTAVRVPGMIGFDMKRSPFLAKAAVRRRNET